MKGGKVFRFSLMLLGVLVGIVIIVMGGRGVNKATSSDAYCMSCHVHSHADDSWKLSSHATNRSGVIVHCSECHLPPKDGDLIHYSWSKLKHGAKDIYSFYAKDSADYEWHLKRTPEAARSFVYNESCLKCHGNIFPVSLTDKGGEAHLRYDMSDDVNKQCISCHIDVGHYNPNAHGANLALLTVEKSGDLYKEATTVHGFENFEEHIPETDVSFNLIAVKGGRYLMGSPKGEAYRQLDEGPVREVEVDSFWMGEIEVTWDEYLAFFQETGSQGRKEANAVANLDAITGATPPWGAPDQGWGKGRRPAITMTHHGAVTYCKWLSQVTGKKYRLPTEAEWEYAARGGLQTPYFFEGEPEDFEDIGLKAKLFGPDTTLINRYVAYSENSPNMTQEPDFVLANPFGLKNMLGNVAEFCLDYYDPMVYRKYPKGLVKNPRGPRSAQEFVVRGGSFRGSAKDLRVANRSRTYTKKWLVTDPQIPKSIWWYSDVKSVGFRVVCEVDKKK